MSRIRILEYGVKPADQFAFNPDNPRAHPEHQRKAVKAALDEIGWIGVVIENQQTGYLVDGHERVWQALDANEDVPYVLVDLTPEEELKALATFDPLGAMAITSKQRIADIKERANLRAKELRDMVGQVQKRAVQMDEDYTDLDPDAVYDVPDALFASDNAWGIPTLDPALQATTLGLPLEIWGETTRRKRMNGTWAFYTDDYRFEALWDDPAPVVNTRCANAVEPNFTTGRQMPPAVALWSIYRKRWIARWWQVCGIRIFVDMNVSKRFYDLNFLGVPKGWKAYATRGYSDQLDATLEEYALACQHADSESITFVVYGGGRATQELCQQRGLIWIDETMNRKKRGNADG